MLWSLNNVGRFLCLVIVTMTCYPIFGQQRVAVRTNLPYDATLSPNLGLELRVDSTWTLGANVGVNLWDADQQKNRKWRHALVNPYARKYLVSRDTLQYYWQHSDSLRLRRASYIEADFIYSHYNVGNVKFPFGLYPSVRDHRLQGDLVAVGAKYGCSWALSRNWRIEAEGGVAVGYAWFREYDCPTCGSFLGKGDRLFLLPLFGINVVYLIN